ncbi:MAG: amidohydrolase family protein [Burkholderiales bacterium]|jgi:L-fuconolactonase
MTAAPRNVVPPDPARLARQAPEEILDPDRPIVDAHHHLWDRPDHRYLLPELLEDTGSGHRVVSTVFIDCMAFYRAGASRLMRTVGETEFANGVAAMAASGVYGSTLACAAIVSHVDLTAGAPAVREALQAHVAAGNGRFRGIRHAGAWDVDTRVPRSHTNPPQGLYGQADFREGFAQLAPLGLSFEAWQYHPQLDEVLALARDFPQTSIILNHVGGPLGIGPYAGRQDETFAQWQQGMTALAACPNVVVKLGGLGMRIGVFDHHEQGDPPGSQEVAQAWAPWIHGAIERFGADRCLFESNFPVDKITCSYAVLWNAFKRMAQGASEAEKTALFSGTATRVYRL